MYIKVISFAYTNWHKPNIITIYYDEFTMNIGENTQPFFVSHSLLVVQFHTNV